MYLILGSGGLLGDFIQKIIFDLELDELACLQAMIIILKIYNAHIVEKNGI